MSAVTGTGHLVRLTLRRDRILLPLWVLLLGLVPVSYVASIDQLFPTAAGRLSYATASAHNAGFVALYGRLFGSSLGELVAWRAGFLPVVIGLAAILTVVRHTRTEEDTGRRELLGATVLGRHAGLVAALLTTCTATLLLGAILALGMIGQGLPVTGSVAFGVQLAAVGWVFAAVGGVAAQLTSAAGSARGIAIAVVGASFVLRCVGDISALSNGGLSWLSWLSPIGWVQRIRPYGDTRWWPVALIVGGALLLVLAAFVLSARRDVGAGLLPPRLGRASAAPSLRSPLALAWRLHRGLLAGWVAGFVALGVVLGYLAEGTGELVGDNRQMKQIITQMGGASALVDSYLAGTMGLLGLIAGAYAIQATLRLRTEESSGRAEPVLGTAVSRYRWVASHLVFALFGPAAALAAGGLAMGLAHGLNTGDVGREVPRVLAGAMVQLPAVWVLVAVTLMVLGLAPRLAPASWAALAVCLLFGMVGAILRLSQWILDISPFTHIPRLPGSSVSVAPLIWLSVLAAILIGAGLAALRRRNLPVG